MAVKNDFGGFSSSDDSEAPSGHVGFFEFTVYFQKYIFGDFFGPFFAYLKAFGAIQRRRVGALALSRQETELTGDFERGE